ncbi:TPA: hypothetical protein ACGVAJ_003237, partial [Vibrio vulnificus]
MVSWSPISLDNADFSSLGMGWLCFLVFPIASLRCVSSLTQKRTHLGKHQSSPVFILASRLEEYWYCFTLNMKEIHGLGMSGGRKSTHQ